MTDWRHRAACREVDDKNLFFPVGNTGPALLQIEDAKDVCRRCDSIDACLQWALESGQDAGVWGGMSEDERRALKRRAARGQQRYGAEVREDAVRAYGEIRGEHASDWAACVAVAERFGIARVKTVLAWTSGDPEVVGERKPGRRPDPELRARAVELVAQVRPSHGSDKAACRAVADRIGVHESTVSDWLRLARSAATAGAEA